MKNRKVRILAGFLFIVIFTVPLFPQAKYYDYKDAGLSIWVPQNWQAKEHGMLVLTPEKEDMSIQVLVTSHDNLDRAVKESMIELKAMFPTDTDYNINEIIVNGMTVKEIGKTFEKKRIDYYLIQTPDGKVVKLFCIAMKDIALQYKDELQKIVTSIKTI